MIFEYKNCEEQQLSEYQKLLSLLKERIIIKKFSDYHETNDKVYFRVNTEPYQFNINKSEEKKVEKHIRLFLSVLYENIEDDNILMVSYHNDFNKFILYVEIKKYIKRKNKHFKI